jgi:hypothetical protein
LDPATLADIQNRCVEFKAHFGVAVPGDFGQAPLKFLNRILAEKAGLKILSRRTHDRTRWYRLDPDTVSELGKTMRRRREALQATGGWPWIEPGPPVPLPGLRHPFQGSGAPPQGPPVSLQARPEPGIRWCRAAPTKPLPDRPTPVACEQGTHNS